MYKHGDADLQFHLRKLSYETTEISVRILRAGEPTPRPETYAKQQSQPQDAQPTLVTYGSRKIGGMRQSKRIRQVKELGKRKKLTIMPAMTVKELKIQVRHLFLQGPAGTPLLALELTLLRG